MHMHTPGDQSGVPLSQQGVFEDELSPASLPPKDLEPRPALNILIMMLAHSALWISLWIVEQSWHWAASAAAVLVFMHVGNTAFALLHESVHHVFSRNRTVNDWAGRINAAAFPTSFTFQRICHLSHHLRNRTNHEMFDLYTPEDNRFMKFAQFYAILTGVYGLTLPLGNLVYLVFPSAYRLLQKDVHWLKRTGAIMMAPFINHPKKNLLRAEMLFSLCYQLALCWLLSISAGTWLMCYWLFGMYWGSLQYADHAWSVRDIRNGAWNLRTHPLIQALFLNYHLHLVHHRAPWIPWHSLPRYVRETDPRPRFSRMWLQMWKGPRPLNAPDPEPVTEAFTALVLNGHLAGSIQQERGASPHRAYS